MKITQYCSVCKQSLEMEVVPTGEGDDDGVIWFRCPQCQGFLPKISGEGLGPATAAAADVAETDDPAQATDPTDLEPSDVPRSPAQQLDPTDTSRAPAAKAANGNVADDAAAAAKAAKERAESEQRLAEYAVRLNACDPADAVAYRPWKTYAKGDLIHHLAWDDCGLVVEKETLPGNRRVVAVYFENKGVVRLIEDDEKGP